VFVTCVTALIVLLLALGGVTPKDVMGARALNTVAGVFEFEVDPQGNTQTKTWEWK